MKKSIVAFVLLGILLPAAASFAEVEAVKTEVGSLQISGLFQAGFNYYIGDERLEHLDVDLNHDGDIARDGSESNLPAAVDRESDMEFVINRLRLSLLATVLEDHVGCFFMAEFGNPVGPQTLDAKLAFGNYIPYTTLAIGRFVPSFTYWAPMNMGKIFLIELPQMNEFLGVQRQTGVNVGVFHKYIEFDFGAFNGRYEPNLSLNPADRHGKALGQNDSTHWGDENTAKDVYASFAVKPFVGFRVFGGYWYGRPLDYFELKDGEKVAHDANVGLIDGGIAFYTDIGLHFWGEVMHQTVRFDKDSSENPSAARAKDTYEYQAMSWYAMGAYNFKSVGVPFELAVRYDWLDPDLTNDAKTHGKDDEITHITGGFNYYIKDIYAMFSINYIYKAERYKVLDKKLLGEQTGIRNDVILSQVQVAF